MDKKSKGRPPFMKYIAYLQVIGIVLVVLGHSFHEYPGGNFGMDMLMYRMMHSFRMPLFVFVSGFLMVYTTILRVDASPLPSFVWNKVKRLLLPFVVLSLVTFFPRTLMSGVADDAMTADVATFADALLYNGKLVIPYYWFLQASFLLLVFNYAMISLGRKSGLDDRWVYLLLLVFFLVLPLCSFERQAFFSIEKAIDLGGYFVAGSVFARYSDSIDRMVPWRSPCFLLLCILVWAGLFFLLEHTRWFAVCSMVGICMCVSMAKILEHRNYGFLDHLIGANYLIFLLSWYCNVASQQVLSHFVALPWWVYSVLSLVSGIYVPWLGYRYLKTHSHSRWVRVAAFLLGQNIQSGSRKTNNADCK